MNNKKQCIYCHNQFDNFTTYRGGSAAIPRNMLLLDVIGSDVDQFGCPVCGAHDRERHLKLYCDELKLFNRFTNARILHFAPEIHFLRYIASYRPELHIKADFLSSSLTVLALNIEAIPYDDHSFDIVIANHILEHVSNIELALSEINRVLKPDGFAILQTPFSRKLIKTFEDAGINTDILRLEFYGQEDHVRLFGQDIFERFSEFLQTAVVSHAAALGHQNTSIYGVNQNEPLFLFRHKANIEQYNAPLGARTEDEIMSSWNKSNSLVSIHCVTYNHENYIASTIESFLMQQTNFPFEIVIGEDCSTDHTLEVIRSYESRYPSIIRIVSDTHNVGAHKNFIRTLNACRGKYIALCEGDDYWTDARKLQKQIDVLENDSDCVITYGAVQAFDENGIVYEYSGGALADLSAVQLIESHPINSLTVCFRNYLVTLPPESFTTGYGDLYLWSLLGHHGHGRYIDSILPSRYRIHSGGVHSTKARYEQFAMMIETDFSLYLYYKRIGETNLAAFFLKRVQHYGLIIYQLTDAQQARSALDELPRKMKLKSQDRYDFDESELILLLTNENLESFRLQLQASVPNAAVSPINAAVVSIIICSIDDIKFAQVSQNYAEVLAGVPYEIIRIPDAKSMCEGYNRGIKMAQGQILIFSHDDIKILSPDFWTKLTSHLLQYDIVGVAGTSLLTGSKWPAIGPPFVHGMVCHKTSDGKLSVDQFGSEHATCVGDIQALDGLFFAAHRRVVDHLHFDEDTFEGFHFYDIDFSYAAFRAGFKLGVCCDIAIIHNSRGQVDQSWESNAYFFLEKYKNVLPSIKNASKFVYASTEFDNEESVLTFYKVINGELSAPYASTLGQKVNSNLLAKYPDRIRQYWDWEAKTAVSEVDAEIFAERMLTKWNKRPVFHLLIWLVPGEESRLADTLDALSSQFYGEWRLSVVTVLPVPDSLWVELEQLKWYQCEAETWFTTLNNAVKLTESDWVWFLPPGAMLEPHALLCVADYINARPDWKFIYTDDDRIGPDGTHFDPQFKPDFNPDLLRALPYMGESIICERDFLVTSHGYANYPGWENYALALAASFDLNDTQIGHVSKVLVHYPNKRNFWAQEHSIGLQVLSDALRIHHTPASVESGLGKNTFRVNYSYPGDPLVSILIPTRDKLEYLRPCVESVLEKTSYSNFEILIADNQSCFPETLVWFDSIQKQYPEKVRVLTYDAAFNFSAICNYLAEQANGEYVLLLNNDTQVLQDGWLDRLVSIGKRPDVGVVGCRLLFPEDGTIQHAGVVLGLGSVASHAFMGAGGINYAGYMQRALCEQNYSAVTAAVMLVKKDIYKEVGGMDEANFAVLFNDVDLCLKIGQKGFRVVYTPHATLFHHESKSIRDKSMEDAQKIKSNQRALNEINIFANKWRDLITHDPAWNINLSLASSDIQVEHVLAPGWDVNFHDRPRVLGLPATGGAGEYRIIAPLRALRNSGVMQISWAYSDKSFRTRIISEFELARLAPDTILFHAPLSDEQLMSLSAYEQYIPSVLRIGSFDDLLTQVPDKNSFKRFGYKDIERRVREAMQKLDRVIVSTEPLRQWCLSYGAKDVRILPNCLEMAKWGNLSSQRGAGKKPRVGWAGAQQHQGDLELLEEVVRILANEVEWIFFGMCPDELKPYIHEFHDFELNFDQYPAKLASLNLDLALAPLEIHPFNEAKSNLRLLEYGIMGWPVICTDIYPFQTNNAPVCRLPNIAGLWIDAIRDRINDLPSAYKEGDELQQWVKDNYLIEDHLTDWLSALTR